MINKAYKVIVDRTCPACGLGFTNSIGKNVYECNYSQCHARFDFSLFSDEEIKKALNPESAEEKSRGEQPRGSAAAVFEFGAFRGEPAAEPQQIVVKEETAQKTALSTGVLSEEELLHLASLPQLTPHLIVELDERGRIAYCNPAAQKLFDELDLGQRDAALLVGGEASTFFTDFAEGGEHQILKRELQIGGRLFSESIQYLPATKRLRIFAHEVTERKEIEERLKLFAGALEHADEGVQIVDLEGRILYANRAMERICGYSPEELEGAPADVVLGEPEFVGHELLPAVKATGRWAGEISAKHRDGRTIPLSLKASLVKDNEGLPAAIVGTVREIALPEAAAAAVISPEAPADSPAIAPPELTPFEQRLGQTLERGELVVYYQPQVDSSISRIIGAEALVRWNHPERGLLTPPEFISAAEQTGFIISLDEWVLRTACGQVAAWKNEGYPELSATVNLSARQLRQPDLSAVVARVLGETGLEPGSLEIEIAESALAEGAELAVENLHRLREMGVALALDDFGSGLSSLRCLRTVPVQRVKIDRSVIKGITENPDDLAIVKAIVAAGSGLGLRVIAEGVETVEQLMLLQKNGCDEVQGFYFSKPVPAAAFTELKVLYR